MNNLKFVFIFVFIFAACGPGAGGPSPGETVAAFLGYLQSGEYDEAHALILNEPALAWFDIEEEYKVIFRNLSFGEMEEIIDGSSAAVTLTISNLDFAAVMEEVMAEAFYLVFSNITEAELAERIEDLLMDKLYSENSPSFDMEIIVFLEMADRQWGIVADGALADAVTGGLLSFAEYAEAWGLN